MARLLVRRSRRPVVFVALAAAGTLVSGAFGQVGVQRRPIIAGDTISADGSGMVLVSAGASCSGTLLTNDWVITAAHCALDIATPATIMVTMGSQSSAGAFAVNHPSLDFALVRLAQPFRMNGSAAGFRMPLYAGTTESLGDQTLTCRGYGCNRYTVPANDSNWTQCDGIDGTLREAQLPVKKGDYDDYNFDVAANDRGQLTGPGDSGTGCFVPTPAGLVLAGILKSGSRPDSGGTAHLGRPENWRDWATAYIEGTSVPLPAQWFVPGAQPPTFLKRPLGNNASGSHTWDPCPGQSYEFSPVYDVEAGDVVTLSSAGSTARLNGRGRLACRGRGPITATLQTNGDNRSTGLLAMPVACTAGPGPDVGCAEAFLVQGWTGAWGSDGPITLGDLNGDGRTDVFMWRETDKSWTVNLSTGTGFTMGQWKGAWGSDGPMLVGDLNGDRRTDVFMWRASDNSWTVNLSTGSGFSTGRWTGAWGSDGPIRVGDLNGDGKTDVFMWRDSDKSWTINLSTGAGFNATRWQGAWGSDGEIRVGDLNGDGKSDVFMWRDSDKSWTINLSTGAGFTPVRWQGAWGSDGPVHTGDLNADGKTDVFMWRASDRSWTINLSTGAGFATQRWQGAWGSDGPMFTGDINGDRRTDVFMWRASDKSWTINLSTGGGFTMTRRVGAWGSDGAIFVGDLNADGKSDVFMWRTATKTWSINLSE